MKLKLLLCLLLIGSQCLATEYKVYYPKKIEHPQIAVSIGSGVLIVSVRGYVKGTPVLYDCHIPRMERGQTNTIIGVPSNADHIYVKKQD